MYDVVISWGIPIYGVLRVVDWNFKEAFPSNGTPKTDSSDMVFVLLLTLEPLSSTPITLKAFDFF